jgi:hypothetical protein
VCPSDHVAPSSRGDGTRAVSCRPDNVQSRRSTPARQARRVAVSSGAPTRAPLARCGRSHRPASSEGALRRPAAPYPAQLASRSTRCVPRFADRWHVRPSAIEIPSAAADAIRWARRLAEAPRPRRDPVHCQAVCGTRATLS